MNEDRPMRTHKLVVHGGGYYGRTVSGRLEPAPPGRPDVIICRRVVDFPNGTPPTGAAVCGCAQCDAAIAFNPRGPHPDRPRICLQCAHIQPLPIEDGLQ